MDSFRSITGTSGCDEGVSIYLHSISMASTAGLEAKDQVRVSYVSGLAGCQFAFRHHELLRLVSLCDGSGTMGHRRFMDDLCASANVTSITLSLLLATWFGYD
jgi:hypothetical protein